MKAFDPSNEKTMRAFFSVDDVRPEELAGFGLPHRIESGGQGLATFQFWALEANDGTRLVLEYSVDVRALLVFSPKRFTDVAHAAALLGLSGARVSAIRHQ